MRPFFCLILILNLLKAGAHLPDSLLSVSQKLRTDTDRVNFFYSEGFLNRSTDPQYSFECAKMAEEFAQKASQPLYIAKASSLLGVLYYRRHDFNRALSYHKKALNLRSIINDKRGTALSQTNLGNVYSDLGRFDLAEKAYLEALAFQNDMGNREQVGNCLLNLGVLNMEIKKPAIAKNYFDQAIKNAMLRFDYALQASCLNNLAVINIAMEQWDDAIANCINSIKIKGLMDNEMEMADSYLNLALVYFKKKESLAGLENLAIADSIIRRYDYTAAKINSLKLKADHYSAEKNYEAAYTFLAGYEHLKDSLGKAEKIIDLSNDFLDEHINKAMAAPGAFKFPYLYLDVLIATFVLVFIFVFKPQQ